MKEKMLVLFIIIYTGIGLGTRSDVVFVHDKLVVYLSLRLPSYRPFFNIEKEKVMNIMKMIGTAISGATGLAALAISITNMVSKAKKSNQ